MKLREYYLGLTPEQREAYAKRAGTTIGYLPQLMTWHRFPKPNLMKALAEASEGNVSRDEVLEHFYSQAPNRAEGSQEAAA